MKRLTVITAIALVCVICSAQTVISPNKKLKAEFIQQENKTMLMVHYNNVKVNSVTFGLECMNEQYDNLTFVSSKKAKVKESYTAVHGKRAKRTNKANELKVNFSNPSGHPIAIIVRAYNDGIAFRYSLPQATSESVLNADHTCYDLSASTSRWQQKYITCYEEDFPEHTSFDDGQWGYPLLTKTSNAWTLITEADIDRFCCATHLRSEGTKYYVTFPFDWEGRNTGSVCPTLCSNWQSPWRVMIIGELSTIVESTLVEDVCPASRIKDTSWIKPGRASWVYWAYNRGTKDFQICKQYVDLAKAMNWEYILFDWEWDQMSNGGNLRDAADYAASNGIKPLLWYNSGGDHTYVMGTPRDRMITHESRIKEFKWLKEMGFVGVKVDFFESDKQNMMNYYIDILEDAADMQMMVDFHGCTLPRGWSRTYPNLISMEAVFGAEQYNNTPRMTNTAPRLNCTLPFTRNVVGPMDYTPVAFTNSQHPHITTSNHELALAVVFESAIQNWADRPLGFYSLPDDKKDFMKYVPTAWDDTKFIDGYPGKYIVMARRKGDKWYVAALNGEDKAIDIVIDLSFIKKPAQTITLQPYDGYVSIIENIR